MIKGSLPLPKASPQIKRTRAMESFDSYVGGGEDLQGARPFDGDGYTGYDPRLASQRFDTFGMPEDGYGGEDQYISNQNRDLGGEEYEEGEDAFSTVKRGSSNGGFDAPPVYQSTFDDDLGDGQHSPAMSSPFGQSFESRLHSEFTPADDFSPSVDSNGKDFDAGFGNGGLDPMYGYAPNGSLNGAVLPPPDEMQAEEGFILREWKRQNAIRLEEKARLEREKLSQIIDAADTYKDEFYEKRRTHCETNQKNNRDKEKVFLENQVTFHATADKQYWKAVGELIPHELPSLEGRSRGKDKKKPSVVINHGPKPGKATDLTRMRQVLVKLKHNLPEHMKPKPPPPPPAPAAAAPGAEGADGKAPPAAAPADTAPLQKQGSNPVVAAA